MQIGRPALDLPGEARLDWQVLCDLATRLGYPRSLREPTAGELALVALPGLAGLLVFTLSGGVIGYRQANSAHVFRTQSAARFLR